MAEDSKPVERRALTEALIKKVDSVYDSPQLRAAELWSIIRAHSEATDWDTICFAAEALGLLSGRYPYLREAAKRLVHLVYSAHYFYPENFNARFGQLGDRSEEWKYARPPQSNSAGVDAPVTSSEGSDKVD